MLHSYYNEQLLEDKVEEEKTIWEHIEKYIHKCVELEGKKIKKRETNLEKFESGGESSCTSPKAQKGKNKVDLHVEF